MGLGRNSFASSDHLTYKKSPEPLPIGLAESHENNTKGQAKKGSFMEYYNSISKKKSSTNLLEKYIKTKR